MYRSVCILAVGLAGVLTHYDKVETLSGSCILTLSTLMRCVYNGTADNVTIKEKLHRPLLVYIELEIIYTTFIFDLVNSYLCRACED